MYDALVAHLRECAKYDKTENTFAEAADAIEELSRENESLAKSVNEAAELLHKRRTSPTQSNASNTLDALTNADRIRTADIECLISWFCRGRLCYTCPYNGVECGIRDWLEEEVKE